MFKRNLWIIVVFLGTVATAIGLGVLISRQVIDGRDQTYRLSREIKSREILNEMGTIQVGDVVPDYQFLDAGGLPVLLSNQSKGRNLVTYFEPGCEACLADLQMLGSIADSTIGTRITLMTGADPATLREVQERLGTNFQAIFDENERYAQALHIGSTPFTLALEDSLRIHRIVVGALTRDECLEIVDWIMNDD